MLDEQTKSMLPKIIQDTMAAITENTNAPDEITLPVTLAVATFATQALVDGKPLQWPRCPISNFFCVLVPSGGLKTSISDSILEGARRFEESQRQTSEDAWTDYQIEMKKYESQIKQKAKEDDPINIPGMITPAAQTPFTKIEKPQYPRRARYIISKFTLNGFLNMLQGVPHAGIFNSDAAEFFNSHAFKDSQTSVEIVSAMSRLWSGENIDKLTGIEDISTNNKRTTALFMLQQEHAHFLENPAFRDQGFTHRMLVTQCELIEKKRADFSTNGLNKINQNYDKLQPFNDRVFELLSSVDNNQKNVKKGGFFAMRQQLMNIREDINTLQLDTIKINEVDDSYKLLEFFYNDMLDKQKDKRYEKYINFMARAYEHCIRLATVLAVFDKKDMVNEREIACSIGLMYYFIEQRLSLNINGKIRENDIVNCAYKVFEFVKRLKEEEPNTCITKTVLNNKGPNMYIKMESGHREKVLQEMKDRDWIKIVKEGKKSEIVLL